jgi:CRP-like cAMP-binding protein
MTELEECINSHFGVVSSDDMETIVSMFELTVLKKGEYLLKSGKCCDQLSFVQSGLLRMFVLIDGKEVTQWISTPGYFSTDLSSFIFESPSRWTIQAMVDTELYSISKTNYKMLNELVQAWNELEKMFLIRCFITLENRIFSHLSMTAEERYRFFFENNKELFNQVPLQFIASMLGMTPETFSRIRKRQCL